ncbi:MAG TPA: glycosyltransferase family 4 protein [Candidatus Paceibacterota bacterium]
MKILLAAGIFYPDVGGPAIHVRKIAERLKSEGFEPIVIAYGDDPDNKKFNFEIVRISRSHHKVFQWLIYIWRAITFAFKSKMVYAFDPTAAGLPARIAAYVAGKPFAIRIGGDPIWEREAEMGKRVMSITDYYNLNLFKKDKPVLYHFIKWLVNSAHVVIFYNQFWKDFYNKYYSLPFEKIRIIKNPIFRKEKALPELTDDPQIIFAGRFVTYKNLPLVMRAFDKVRTNLNRGKLLLVGKGPEFETLLEIKNGLSSSSHINFLESLPQEKLFDEIRRSAISLGPALSEFNPNFILESLSLGKPVILSKGHGLSVDLPEEFLFNPLDENELVSKMKYLLDPQNYKKAVETVSDLDMSQTWEKVTDFHLALVKEFTK